MNATRKFYDSMSVCFLKLLPYFTMEIRPGKAGFFGELFITLNGLRLAELNQIQARVCWGVNSPYYESGYGANAWDYFFQKSEFDFSNHRLIKNSINLSYRPGGGDFVPYDGLSVKKSINKALHVWCKPHFEILDAVDSYVNENFHSYKAVLGVHVRLTDAAAGMESRRVINMVDILNSVDSWLSKNHNSGIFLASDEEQVVSMFNSRYPGIVYSQDCIRSTDGTSIHGHYDEGVQGSAYSKGREVLIDALILARCDHLIRTHSRVTAFSICWNPLLTYQDLELELLGVNRTPWLHYD